MIGRIKQIIERGQMSSKGVLLTLLQNSTNKTFADQEEQARIESMWAPLRDFCPTHRVQELYYHHLILSKTNSLLSIYFFKMSSFLLTLFPSIHIEKKRTSTFYKTYFVLHLYKGTKPVDELLLMGKMKNDFAL